MILGSGLLQAANSFIGAYDAIPSIAAAYSTRRLLTSYTGPLLRLVADRTGYPEQDIGYTGTGDLDTAAAATFLDGDAGYVATWYDQSGGGHHATQAVLATMPLYVASGQNSKPVLRSELGERYLTSSGLQLANENSLLIAWKPTDISDADIVRYAGHFGSGQLRSIDKKPGIYSSSGSGYHSSAMANGTPCTIFYTFDGNVQVSLSGSNETVTATTPVFTDSDFGIFRAATSGTSPSDMFELVAMSAAATTAQRQAAEAAANAYWSIY